MKVRQLYQDPDSDDLSELREKLRFDKLDKREKANKMRARERKNLKYKTLRDSGLRRHRPPPEPREE